MDDPRLPLLDATRAAALDGPGEVAAEVRRALAEGRGPPELQGLLAKIRTAPWTVSDEDWAPLRASFGEDAQFEWVIAAVLGAAGDRYQAAMRALEAATSEAKGGG